MEWGEEAFGIWEGCGCVDAWMVSVSASSGIQFHVGWRHVLCSVSVMWSGTSDVTACLRLARLVARYM